VNPEQARGWGAEMFKRLWWSGSKAKFYAVTWRAYEGQVLGITPNLQINIQHAFKTAQPLKSFISSLPGPITVAGHSLGNMLIGAAVKDHGMTPERWIMIDGAVAIEAFDIAADKSPDLTHPYWDGYDENLFASEWHKKFLSTPSDHRGKLTWRGLFSEVGHVDIYNIYSTGEEVLRTHPFDNFPGVDDMVSPQGVFTWALQEKLKGWGVTGHILTSNYGGWAFNRDQFVADTASGIPGKRLMTQDEAKTLSDEVLKIAPFFHPGPFELYGAGGSDYAKVNRIKLLSEMIPCRTWPVGANPLGSIDPTKNFNMNSAIDTPNGWPRDTEEWFHSDVKDVAYPYSYRAFNEMTKMGGL
jgi:hypothetical protein